ncbi:MAG: response regulator transcription factor [Candidatus Acidiferrum sp.]
MQKIRILLADDHRRLLELVQGLLEPTFDVVGCVKDGEALLEAAAKLQPDVIVTDISMPKLDGIEAAGRLRESGSTLKIVFLTVHADADFVQAVLNTGALTYVTKSRIDTDLVVAIGEALAGRMFISPLESAV